MDEQKKTSIDQAPFQSGIMAKVIEKDWLETLTLKALFQSAYKEQLVFQGGTTLGNCWKIIKRFSEDIDITINQEVFGMKYIGNPTKS